MLVTGAGEFKRKMVHRSLPLPLGFLLFVCVAIPGRRKLRETSKYARQPLVITARYRDGRVSARALYSSNLSLLIVRALVFSGAIKQMAFVSPSENSRPKVI